MRIYTYKIIPIFGSDDQPCRIRLVAYSRRPEDILEPDPRPHPRRNVKQGEARDSERHALFTQVVKAASGLFLRNGRRAPAIR